jgi:hypothetical protein
MDISNENPDDQDSTRPGNPQDSARYSGGTFWPPGRWRRQVRVAVSLGVVAAVVAGGVTAAVAANGSPAPAAARTLASGSGPLDAGTAGLLAVLGLAGTPDGAIVAGPGGAVVDRLAGTVVAGPGGAVVDGPDGIVVTGPDGAVTRRCGPLGARLQAPATRPRDARPRGLIARVRARAGLLCAGVRPPGPAAMYGQLSFRTKDGKTETAAFERGVIQSVSGDSVVVKAADGQTQTWLLTSDSQIRDRPATVTPGTVRPGREGSRSDLTAGRNVLVAGTIENGTRELRLAVILPAGVTPPSASVPSPPSPAPSSPAPSAPAT